MAFRVPFCGNQLKVSKPATLIHQKTFLKGYGSNQFNSINNISKTFFSLRQTTIQIANPLPTSIDSFVRWNQVDKRKRQTAHKQLKKQKLAAAKEAKRAHQMSKEIRDPLVAQAYKEIEEEDMGRKVETKKKRRSDDEDDDDDDTLFEDRF